MVQFTDEIWKPVSYNTNYLVSNYGRVRTINHPVWCKKNNSFSIRKGIMCKLSNNNSKHYWRVAIQIDGKQKHFAVHRLVAEAFIPNTNNLPQVNHIDGNKDNNHVSNLEWCDNSYNNRHAWEHDLKSREKASKNCHFRKLSEEDVKFIKNSFKDIDTTIRGNRAKFLREMASKFNLKSVSTIAWIITGGTNKYM